MTMDLNDLSDSRVTIKVAGQDMDVNADDSIKDTLKGILEEKGIDSFTILVDGNEVESTENLPKTFANHAVEVQRYVKPGC